MVFRPDTFGKYVLLKRIAIGGMAEVFRAKTFGAEGFEKTVAIKRMLSHLSSDSQFVDMFINEAKLSASLTHANIAQIYDFGCIDKMYFLSMEYVFGKDLADLIRILRDKGLGAPIELACYVIIKILNGLDYAHRKTDAFGNPLNLIHRDTSPHNLIISYEGEVKIVDFGIAKAKSTTVQTTGGVLKGKYSYMSPEQAHGMPLDHRTDIFSLGICFYELLTLSKMFQGTSDLSVLEKVRETDFIPPRKLNESIPQELEDLVLKALEKNPEDRWDSAAQWREALEDFLFRANLHYSAAWLSGFVREIFQEDVSLEMRELAEEDEISRQLRRKARKGVRIHSGSETVEFPIQNDSDGMDEHLQSEHTENRPPIREVSSGQFVIFEGEDQKEDDEIGTDFDEADEEEDLSLLDTAIAAFPLGKHPLVDDEGDLPFSESDSTLSQTFSSMEQLPVMDEVDDESMPTVELSRPLGRNARIPPRIPSKMQSIETIEYDESAFDEDQDYEDDDSDISNSTTLDERSQVGSSQADEPEDEEDVSMVTTRDDKNQASLLSRFRIGRQDPPQIIHGHTGESILDPSDFDELLSTTKHPASDPTSDTGGEERVYDDIRASSRDEKEGFSSVTIALILFVALSVGGLVALWQLSFNDDKNVSSNSENASGTSSKIRFDGGMAHMVQKGDEKHDAMLDSIAEQTDGGLSRDKPVEDPVVKNESKQNTNVAIVTAPDDSTAKALTKPDNTPVHKVKANSDKSKKAKRRKRRRVRRKHRPSCPTKGFGTLNVGVSAGWAFVFADGKEIRSTPLTNFKIRAGRHKIVLKKGKNRILKRWNTCIRRGRKVTLIYQSN